MVIGSGPGGYVAAIKAAQLGMKVIVVKPLYEIIYINMKGCHTLMSYQANFLRSLNLFYMFG